MKRDEALNKCPTRCNKCNL